MAKSSNSVAPNILGAIFMIVAMAGFTINDVFVKTLLETLDLGQIIFLRGIFATVLIAIYAWRTGMWQKLQAPFDKHVFWRAAMEVVATYTFLTALGHIPIANAAAILAALPLVVTMAGAIFLKEKVGWRRWTAIVVGFIGILLIVKPGSDGFNFYSILAFICVLFAAARDIITRKAPKTIPSLYFTLTTAIAITFLGGGLSLTVVEWQPMSANLWLLIAFASVFIISGYHFIILAMQTGEIAAVTPFRYTALIWAAIGGIIIFGEVPDSLTILGSLIIVATGIYTFIRERKLASENTA